MDPNLAATMAGSGWGALLWAEALLGALALALALAMRPWRLLAGGALISPVLGTLALLPALWLVPQHLPVGLPVQFSGACLVLLMLGWPLAVPVLALVGVLVWLLGDAGAASALSQWFWMGLVPATLAFFIGAAIRHWLPPHIFIYTLGRGFLGTALAVFVAGVLFELAHTMTGSHDFVQAVVARWLMAWGDAFITGMLVAVFVAFAPQWLATWSDARYLHPPRNNKP